MKQKHIRNDGLQDSQDVRKCKRVVWSSGVTTAACHIMVINSGSSSLKFSLFDVRSESVVATGIAERLGTAEAVLKFSGSCDQKRLNISRFFIPRSTRHGMSETGNTAAAASLKRLVWLALSFQPMKSS
jgi:Acetokinase family